MIKYILAIMILLTPVTGDAYDITCGKKLKASAKILSIDRILDGDTADVTILMTPEQFGVKQMFRYRLLGNDTPEKVGKSKPEGLKATVAATEWLTKNKDYLVAEFYGTGKFGRALTIIRSSKTKETLNEFLIKEGHHTRGTEAYCGGKR
jgi:endonuclease YncB( thermonuclease family)